MLDAAKDYLTPKTFSILVYACSIVHFLCGVVFTGIVVALKEAETGKFTCYVAPESTEIYKTQVDKACYSRYQENYNSPLPFYGFAILSIWFPVIVAVIYSLGVRRRVEEIDSRSEPQIQSEAESQVLNRTLHVYYFYFFHLSIRVLSGILFTILQYAAFFPSGFDSKFSCKRPTGFTSKTPVNASDILLNSTSITCENSSASEKQLWWVIVSVLNTGFASLMLVEIICLCRRLVPTCDTEFITDYLLRKHYRRVKSYKLTNLQENIDFYKEQVLEPSRTTDVISGPKTRLDDLYVDVVIHTERAAHKFSKDMQRHEIFDVYMEVPQHSILLKEIKDLFYPNKDTKGISPHKILAVGRPGIGKTVLTEKIMRDWANGVDIFYHLKIVFYFKFRWFDSNELKEITLKAFLRYGTGLSDEKFDKIYQDIMNRPEKAILIFDGLDEFGGNVDCLDHLQPPNDPNISMSAISLFIKLISGCLLSKATVLVTSRPTANEFYSRLAFDRTVEILGFTSDKIENYVSQFCENNSRGDLKQKIWKHIKSSSDLLNLCYIPVNCFIVCTILFECVIDPRNDTGAVPTTVTELYQSAITYFDKHHNRKLSGQSSEEAIRKLQLLAYDGIERMRLLFDGEFDEEIKNSGLLNSLSSPIKTQFCFIHLTVQEFLAARHVTETFTPEKIKEFILSHIESSKWHLVLQFIAGQLGKKNGFKNCVLVFAKSFVCEDGILDVTDNGVLFVMKCLREADNEDIAKEACETTALDDVVSLNAKSWGPGLTSSDWAAVIFVCKHIKKLTKLDFYLSDSGEECYLEVKKLLQQRCIKQLVFRGLFGEDILAGHLFKALLESNCSLKHEHVSLTELDIDRFRVTDEECLSMMCEFFRNGHASCLKKLTLTNCKISSRGVSIFCKVLHNGLCPELTSLDLTGNSIRDEGVEVLCNSLIEQLFTLTKLYLSDCSLTDECIPPLCKLLTDERCNLTALSLTCNSGITDEGSRVLCESGLKTENCKLAELDMSRCYLTDDCMLELQKALESKHCTLTKINLGYCRSLTEVSV